MSPSSDQVAKWQSDSRTFLEQLHEVVSELLSNFELNSSDDFGFVSYLFLCKQHGHADAILRLGDHWDVNLVARSMMEGLFAMKWIVVDPQIRSRKFREFVAVRDWRHMRSTEIAGSSVRQDERNKVRDRLESVGSAFLRKAAAEIPNNDDGDDPFHWNWTGESVSKLAKNDPDLFAVNYSHFSEWHHWDPGIARALIRKDGALTYSYVATKDVAFAAITAFGCLYDVATLIGNRLLPNHLAKLQALGAQFSEWDKANRPSQTT